MAGAMKRMKKRRGMKGGGSVKKMRGGGAVKKMRKMKKGGKVRSR